MRAQIRAAGPHDTDQLLTLIGDHAAYEHSRATLTRSQLAQHLVDSTSPIHILVADADGVVAGYAALTFDYALWRGALWAHLDCLYLMPRARGAGLGQQLLMAAHDHALARGADRMEWQTPDWNQGAIGFYTGLGASLARKVRFHLPLSNPKANVPQRRHEQ